MSKSVYYFRRYRRINVRCKICDRRTEEEDSLRYYIRMGNVLGNVQLNVLGTVLGNVLRNVVRDVIGSVQG